MLLGMFCYSAADTSAKFLTDDLDPLQIVWSRQMGLTVGVLVLLAVRGLGVLRTAHPKLQITRGVMAACSATLFVVALQYVPLAVAVAVSFVAPFCVTVLGALVLKERVGLRRWLAVLIGFVGMLIVVRPGMGVVHPGALLVVAAAFFFAVRQIISRVLGASDNTETTITYTAFASVVLLTIPQPFVWTTPTQPEQYVALLVLAVMAAIGEILVIKALEIAQAVALAPTHYSLIIWSTFYGFVVFNHLPDFWTLFGAAVIMASGLYTLHRERAASRIGPDIDGG